MHWFRKLFKKSPKSESSFPGQRLSIDQILHLSNSSEMIIELSYGISDKIQREGFDSLSSPEIVLHHIYWLETEVNNGGFEQYFFNSSGNYALDTPAALEEISAHHTADLVKRTIELFPDGTPPRDLHERREKMGEIDDITLDKFDELDTEFYKYQDPLEDLQMKYMVKNKDLNNGQKIGQK
jgi:hypothetical protein